MNQVRLIYKVLSGNASSEEEAALKQWIATSADNKAVFEDIRVLWENTVMTETTNREGSDGFLHIRRLIALKQRRREMVRTFFNIFLFTVVLIFVFAISYFLGTRSNPNIDI
ncbi:MAG TPA: hypothetical protein VD816_08260 [Ohtaekwangia sp.]|nr:hypothetical protein [Ohtaekwangia sp.]